MYARDVVPRTCSVEGCDRPHKARGLCGGHWDRQKKGIPLNEKPLRVFRGEHRAHRPCSVDGCDGAYHGHGYCRKHLQRLRKVGSVDLPEREPAKCKTEGCDRLAKSNQLCQRCAYRIKMYGDPRKTRTSERHECLAPGCEKKSVKQSAFCSNHHYRWKEINGDIKPPKETCDLCGKPETTIGLGGKPRALNLDHCHTSGKFRGWLCQPCNTALGKANDNPALLRKMADYLEAHS